jgi:hypothetical protein
MSAGVQEVLVSDSHTNTFARGYDVLQRRDNAVGIANGYGLDDRGVKNFLFSTSSRPASGPTRHPIQWVLRALSPGVKQPVREGDH